MTQQTVAETKKCKPLNCNHFKRVFDKTYTSMPSDVLVVKCPYRDEGNVCLNSKEILEHEVVPRYK